MKNKQHAGATPGSSKWEIVLRGALAEIADGQFAPGDRFYTLRELGAAYGVSEITAQRVFRELVARGQIATNRRSGARVIAGIPGQTVYLCFRNELFDIPDTVERFRRMNAFLEGFRDTANGQIKTVEPISLDFLLGNIDRFKQTPVLVHATALLDVVDGRGAVNDSLVTQLRTSVNPIVIKGFGPLRDLAMIYYDFYGGFRQVVDHLVRRHTRIGCLTGPPDCVWFRPRFQAFQDGLFAHRLRFVPEWIRVTSGEDKQEDFRAMDAIMKARERPTALVCANDMRALHAIEYCRNQGIRVPDELAITGNDNIPESTVGSPSLTTLDFNDRECGVKAAKWVLKRSAGNFDKPSQHRVPAKLIVRESA